MQNMRRHRDKNVPIVLGRSQKRPPANESATPRNVSKLAYGVANYMPSRPPSEDDASISRHTHILKQQAKRKFKELKTVEFRA